MGMKETINETLLRDLLKLFEDIESLQGRLLQVIGEKVEAMKKNDHAAMRESGEREQLLARTIHEREGLRRQLMDAIGKEAGWPARTARAMSMSQFASRVSKPQQAKLIEAGNKLRLVVSKVARANRVAGQIASRVLNHLQWVFASVRANGEKPIGYTGTGGLMDTNTTLVFDTVG
jgi:hypothetical protein